MWVEKLCKVRAIRVQNRFAVVFHYETQQKAATDISNEFHNQYPDYGTKQSNRSGKPPNCNLEIYTLRE